MNIAGAPYVYNAVYFSHKYICMLSTRWMGPGNMWTPHLLNKRFSTFGKFGDWLWSLCYLFCQRGAWINNVFYLMSPGPVLDKWSWWLCYVGDNMDIRGETTLLLLVFINATGKNDSKQLFCMPEELIWSNFSRWSISLEDFICEKQTVNNRLQPTTRQVS